MSTGMLVGPAAPHELEHEGQTYRFRALTQAAKAAFERWLLGRTRGVLAAIYEGEDLARKLEALEADALAHAYDFHGERCASAMATPAGTVKLASILMGCPEEKVLPLWLARPEEVKHLLRLVLAESGAPAPAGAAAEGAEGNVPAA